jgi:hypothetical protein
LGTVLLIGGEAQTPSTLSNLIHGRFPALLLAVTPVDLVSTNGWMPQVFWDLIRQPKSSGRWPDTPTPYSDRLKALADLYGKAPQQQQRLPTIADILEEYKKQK